MFGRKERRKEGNVLFKRKRNKNKQNERQPYSTADEQTRKTVIFFNHLY